VTLSRLYVARDARITAVSRGRLRMSNTTPVRRNWRALVEVTTPVLTPKPPRSLSDAVLVVLPPALAGSLTAAVAPLEAGIAVGGAVFFAASYLAPVLRRRADHFPLPRPTDQPDRPGSTDQPAQSGRADQVSWSGHTDQPAQPGSADQVSRPGGADQILQSGRADQTSRFSLARPISESGLADRVPRFTLLNRLTRIPWFSRSERTQQPGRSARTQQPGRSDRIPRSDHADLRLLSGAPERAAFQQAVGVADRIAETWPALGALVDPADAEPLLAGALWEISGVLARRQELTAVLAELNRPDFAAAPTTDQTARELRAQVQASRAALTRVGADLARREASLRRAEEAGRHFIREQEMRQAIRAAEDTLRDATPGFPTSTLDPAADLAEQTQSVLTAYRELTADLHTDPPSR
jgi:hypothetical protein